KTILHGNAGWLARRIEQFELTSESVREELERQNPRAKERAFATILRNRVQRGGIMAPGAGLIKNGENGRGILSRWYPETLSKRIRSIGKAKNLFTFIEGDGI